MQIIMTDKPPLSVELSLQAINIKLANQDTMLLEIKTQTLKTNGRVTWLERILWTTAIVILTTAALKGSALLGIVKLLFI